jgi:transposase
VKVPVRSHAPHQARNRKALAAIARSVPVIIFHLLTYPAARFNDLGPGHYDDRVNRERKIARL